MQDSSNKLYPDSDFLRDYDLWDDAVRRTDSPWHNRGQEAAKVVFSRLYQNDPEAFRYRLNRFGCVQIATHQTFPQLIQDRIAHSDGGTGAYIPEHLLLALLAWYRTVPDSSAKSLPTPDWGFVLTEFDRMDSAYGR
jgi:hypothetical protein